MLSGGFWAEGCGLARMGYAPVPPGWAREPPDEDQPGGGRPRPRELCRAVPQLPTRL